MSELITCEDLSLGYEGRVILSGLSFRLEQGDYLYVVGENGSGKSTLMKTILGLRQPYSGKVTLHDLKRSEIGYLPQQTAIQKDFPANCEEVILSGTLARFPFTPFYTKEQHALAEKYMEMMHITHLRKQSYRDLSGGQQQRVLLARAFCAAQKLLVLDEPVTGLDAATTADLYDAIAKANKEGMTVMMISHDIQAALHYAGHILSLDDTFFFGTRKEYTEYANRKAGSSDE